MKGGMLNDEGGGKSQEIFSVEVCSLSHIYSPFIFQRVYGREG